MANLDDKIPPEGPEASDASLRDLDRRLRRKVDLRLCTIAGILCSLNLLDSSILSSASVTSLLSDLELAAGNRFAVAVFIFTLASVACQLPATVAVRLVGPRPFFTATTLAFGLLTLCTAFVRTWRQLIALRVLLGVAMAGIFPGLALLVSCWYTRPEQQLRFAFLQSGQVFVLATGGIVNFGLNKLDGQHGLRGWQWMFLVQGLITCVIGIATWFWMVDFPEHARKTPHFLTKDEQERAVSRIQRDRGDVDAVPFRMSVVLKQFLDVKIYGWAAMFFCLNIVSTALSYFLPLMYAKTDPCLLQAMADTCRIAFRMAWVSVQTSPSCCLNRYV